MKKLISILLLFLSTVAGAQHNDYSISGTIQDRSSKQPVEFATIQLLTTADSALLATTVSDHKGKFVLNNLAAGNYILQCSFIGYEKTVMPVLIDQRKENVGVIGIGTLAKDLSNVTVVARQSMLNTSIDRKVYNVSQDIMAQSGNASDILKNIPSVEVDIEGEVMLRGSADVMILINGKPSPLMGRTRAEVLQQLPANSIERIEVITNPTARYRPDGTSGIINIVLKKNTKAGWNGSVTGNAGTSDRYNGTINLNFKPGKLNLYGTYGIRQDRRNRYNTINRQLYDASGQLSSSYYEDTRSYADPLSQLVILGADLNLDERNSIGLSGNYNYRDMLRRDITQRFYYDKDGLLTGNIDRLRKEPEYETEKDATLYWQHNFPGEEHELRTEVNISSSEESEKSYNANIYKLPAAPATFDNIFAKEGDNQQYVNIDYANTLSDDAKLEAGYNGSFAQLDLDFYNEYFDSSLGHFVNDLSKSNRFKYNETIHALYGTYQRSYRNFGYSAGLRFEQAFINGNLVTKDSAIDNQYFKIYPTLHLFYKWKNGEIQLNYSKRVNRPDGDELNPFPEYQDPYNLRAGNPNLLPEMIHSIELGYKWQNEKFSFVPSVYYRHKQHGFTSIVTALNDSVLLTTEANLSNDRSAGLELILSAKAGNFLTSNLSANFFYNQIDATELGFINNKSVASMSLNFNSTAAITKTTVLQVSCNYRSARLTPQGKSYGNFVMNAGILQDLFKKKLSLILTASDILKTLQQKTELNTPYLKQVFIGKRDARVIYFGISYRFGRVIKKTNEEKLEFDNSL